MQVLKRDSTLEKVDFNKITLRIQNICNEINSIVIDPILIAQKVCAAIHDKVKTTELALYIIIYIFKYLSTEILVLVCLNT